MNPNRLQTYLKEKIGKKSSLVLRCLEKEKISFIFSNETGYPKSLLTLSRPPEVLYYKGNLKEWPRSLAVVGSRKNTPYGQMAASALISGLKNTDITIISGLAYGIDCIAHNAALVNNLTTVAVLGSGIDEKSLYPKTAHSLAAQILLRDGCILSEFPPLTPPLPQNFPQRNRIISGLSRAVVVIEAAKKSGALITARLALEHGKDIFALPGNIFEKNSFIPNMLIQKGAFPVTDSQDILDYFGIVLQKSDNRQFALSEDEKKIVSGLSSAPLYIDEIVRNCGLETHSARSLISILEIKKIIIDTGGKNYILIS